MARALADDKKAFVAVMFALTLVPITGLIGVAIDYGYATRLRAQADLIADSAALAGATAAANTFQTLIANPAQGVVVNADYVRQSTDVAITSGNDAAARYFNSQGSTPEMVSAHFNLEQPNIVSAVSDAASGQTVYGSFQGRVQYTASVSTFFGSLSHYGNFQVNNTSTAVVQAAVYNDVYILADTSSSMLLADSQSGINQLTSQLRKNRPQWFNNPVDSFGEPNVSNDQWTCGFACHWTRVPAQPTDSQSVVNDKNMIAAYDGDFYSLARQAHIQLRIDDVKASTSNLITEFAANPLTKVAVFSFDTGLHKVYPPAAFGQADPSLTANFQAAAAAAADMDVQAIPAPFQYPNTDFDTTLNQVYNMIEAPGGNGSSPNSRKIYLFIISDGVKDTCPPGACPGYAPRYGTFANKVTAPEPDGLTKALCQKFSVVKNVTIGVVPIKYWPLTDGDQSYADLKSQGIIDSMVGDFNACQSKGVPAAQPVASAAEIQNAVRRLYGNVLVTQPAKFIPN